MAEQQIKSQVGEDMPLPTLPTEIWRHILLQSHWTSIGSIHAVSNTWHKEAANPVFEQKVYRNVIESTLNEHTFFKTMKINVSEWLALFGDNVTYKSIFKDQFLEILSELEKLKKIVSKTVPWKEKYEGALSIIGSFSGSRSSTTKSFIGGHPMVPHNADISNWNIGDGKALVAQLDMRDFRHLLSTQDLFPKNGILYFFQTDWQSPSMFHIDTEDYNKLRRARGYAPAEGRLGRRCVAPGIRDTLFVEHWKLESLVKEDLEKDKKWDSREALEDFESGRPWYTFRDGYFPSSNRVGGYESYCNQGNSVLSENERLYIQTSHDGDMWFSFIFCTDIANVGDYSKVKMMMCDDA